MQNEGELLLHPLHGCLSRSGVKYKSSFSVHEHNLPKFKAALLKLGYDETSAAYGRLMELWDEHDRASRHG